MVYKESIMIRAIFYFAMLFVLGCEESLHNVVLALTLVVLGGLLASVGTLRQDPGSASARTA